MKVWAKDDPEPQDWLVVLKGQVDSPDNGSILLLAHYVDVIFGNVLITPLNTGPDTTAPQISDVTVAVEPEGATIHWITDEPATSKVNFGQTSSYDRTVEDSSLVTEHFIYLDSLQTRATVSF
jgi:hypothetical protein